MAIRAAKDEVLAAVHQKDAEIVRLQGQLQTQEQAAKAKGKVKETVKRFIEVIKNNTFCVSRKEETLFLMPVWALVLTLLFAWRAVVPVMVIALFFGIRYSFTGKDDLTNANEFMDKAGAVAEDISEKFKTA